MRRLTKLVLLLFTPSAVAAESGHGVDSFVELYTQIWNSRDTEKLGSLFEEDADVLMGGMPRVAGRAEIVRWWDNYFADIDANRHGEFLLNSRIDVSDDVVLLNVDTRTSGTNSDGEALPVRLARGTWILVRHGDSWKIQAMRGNPAVGENRTTAGTDP